MMDAPSNTYGYTDYPEAPLVEELDGGRVAILCGHLADNEGTGLALQVEADLIRDSGASSHFRLDFSEHNGELALATDRNSFYDAVREFGDAGVVEALAEADWSKLRGFMAGLVRQYYGRLA